MNFYDYKDKKLVSLLELNDCRKISENEVRDYHGGLYYLTALPLNSRRSFLVSDPSLLFIEKEDLSLLRLPPNKEFNIPLWLERRIYSDGICGVNSQYPGWENILDDKPPTSWRINIIGLGDVGGTLLTGLRLLGNEVISEIGIYDLDSNKAERWYHEVSQILSPDTLKPMPRVKVIEENEIFNCDMFVFCVSMGVPPVGEETTDVRMAQYKGNSKIIAMYARKAREEKFKGIFSVVSDPVDLLCCHAYRESNRDPYGKFDFNGLAPEQIRGYGLGVMYARAAFYSSLEPDLSYFSNDGRVFGPHGKGLIVADSIQNYNERRSYELTNKTTAANLEVRKTGFKPYIAPALSSGSLSLIATIKGDWHYSATYLGGVYMGVKNRWTPLGTQIERLDLPETLYQRITATYEGLGKQYEND